MTYTLFVSSKCKYSKEALEIIKKHNEMMEKYEIVDIDSLMELPSYLKSVPTLLINRERVIMGNELHKYLKEESEKYLSAAFDQGFGVNNFSFIGGDGLASGSTDFSYINENQRIETQEIPSNNKGSNGGAGDPRLEALIEARKNEIPNGIQRV